MKRITLELGGKSPNIVCHDANIETAIAAAHMGIFFNAGQVCSAGSRLFVHEAIYDKFVPALVASTKGLNMGNPLKPTTN